LDKEKSYDVAIEPGGAEGQKAGPLFQRYTIRLVGRFDRRWVDCYLKLSGERPALARFRLDPPTASVSFTCRATDGPEEVASVRKRLEEMIALVNESAAAVLATEIERPQPSAPPESKPPEPGKSKIASVAEGLLARFSRRSS
jgi:hypothetical protein